MWPQRGLRTPWGEGVLLGSSRVDVTGAREAPVLVNKRGKPKVARAAADSQPVPTPVAVISAVVIVPRAHAPPIRMYLQPRTVREYQGLEPPQVVHYDLTKLVPVERAAPAPAVQTAVSSFLSGLKPKKGKNWSRSTPVLPTAAADASTTTLNKLTPALSARSPVRSSAAMQPIRQSKAGVSDTSAEFAALTVDTASPKKGSTGFLSRMKSVFSK